jgi:hypothetical protein
MTARSTLPETRGTAYRVHLAAVGFEVERLYQPLVSMHAEIAILLMRSWTDRPRALETLQQVTRLLKQKHIRTESVSCDLWDTNDVVNTIGGIMSAVPAHDYYFNASTGPKPSCIAGVLAASFWPVKTYYVAADYGRPGVRWDEDRHVKGPPKFFTALSTEGPDAAAMAVMTQLVTRGEPVRKKDLIEAMTKEGLIGAASQRASSPQALHGQVDSILWRLEKWGFVRLAGHGKALRISLTEHGKGGYLMFHHRIYPRTPPRVLAS